jgi:hypothetical protein
MITVQEKAYIITKKNLCSLSLTFITRTKLLNTFLRISLKFSKIPKPRALRYNYDILPRLCTKQHVRLVLLFCYSFRKVIDTTMVFKQRARMGPNV